MIVDQIRNALRMQPFRAFALKLTNGTTYVVQHHDWISIPPVQYPAEITYYSVGEKGAESYQTHWINLGQVVEVIDPAELAEQAPKAEGNGA
jgi:hypothetical protein